MAGRAPKTAPTDVPPTAFLDTVDGRRAAEGRVLLDLMREATGTTG